MISDDNFVMQTCVAITSLYRNKGQDTLYDIFVIMADCTQESEEMLIQLNKKDCWINLVHASIEQYKDIKQLAHISTACLLKFDICELIPQYEKLLYLDGDIIVRKDLTELYETELYDNYAAAVKEVVYLRKDNNCINAGIMLFNAKKMRNDRMRDTLVKKRRSLGDRGSMDQQTFNLVLKGEIIFLSIKYNCVPGFFKGDNKMEYSMDELNRFYGTDYQKPEQLINDAIIIHFATGNKPWKYTFAPCAKEWYNYYRLSPYGDMPFKRYSRWGYRFHNIITLLSKDGVRGVYVYLIKRLFRKKKRKKVEWD